MNLFLRKAPLVLAALAAGGLAALAHPPFDFWPGFFGYALLLWLLDRHPERRRRPWAGFGIGWLAGFAYFLVGCFWVAQAFLVDPEAHGWMAPFAATLLPMGLALFWGAAAALHRRFAPHHVGRVFVFASVFVLFEWLRGHVLTGFPWNLPGQTWAAGSPPSQAAAWLGAYGLSWVTVFAMASFAVLFAPGNRKRRIGMATLGALTVASLWVAGSARLAHARVETTNVTVRVVQPDVPQSLKWDEAEFRRIVLRYTALTARPGRVTPDIVVWPEGALPAAFEELIAPGSEAGEAIARSLRPGQTLLMGAYRGEHAPGERSRWFNSLMVLHHDGQNVRVAGYYDKHRLVPFGEYMPLEEWAEKLGLKNLANVGDGYTAGAWPAPITLPNGGRVQPLICYESLFPGFTRRAEGPTWIANVSNDAWFGDTSGPIQHLNLASYRAIETGLPIVRATPTGVSAVIDPYGRTSRDARLNLGEGGVIDARLPAPLPTTLYARVGDLLFWTLLLLGLAPAIPSIRGLRTNRGSENDQQD